VPRTLYPTVEEVIETNRRVLEIIVDRRDRHVVWNENAIAQAIAVSKSLKGDVYEKAALLLIELVQSHPFKSGNRRTATAVVADFLKANGESFKGHGTAVLAGIRLGDFKRAEVKAWLKGIGDQEER
jgi:death-on-curing family protein